MLCHRPAVSSGQRSWCLLLMVLLPVLGWSRLPLAQGQDSLVANSTTKLRVEPSPLASRIGSAIAWEESLERALEKAQAENKHVFWYVPTVPGTFMDRKVEIDRYMKAGPFSWPAIIDRIQSHFVPYRGVPTAEQAQTYDLVRYKFVEPGFLILSSEGKIQQKIDQLTTLHPAWLCQLIGRSVAGIPAYESRLITRSQPGSTLYAAWQSLSQHPEEPLQLDLKLLDSVEQKIEGHLLVGLSQFYQGQHQRARETWGEGLDIDRQHPLAWKCAAEREGFGPLVRGFEVHDALPTEAFSAGTESRGSAAPNGVFEESELWVRSAAFLLLLQREDGAIVDSDYDFGGTDSLPNVHVAVTSLAGSALIRARQAPGINAILKERIDRAIPKAIQYVSNPRHLNPIDRDEILWAYAYRLRFLCKARLAGFSIAPAAMQEAVTGLESVQTKRGNWYHEYANSFVTATALMALRDAQEAKAEVAPDKIELGLQALQRDRFSNGAYPYYSVRRDREKPEDGDLAAAAGRMPLCELARLRWGDSNLEALTFAVEQSDKHYDKLRVAYKYDNHTSTLAYGGFFFWFDLQSRAEAIAALPAGDKRRHWADRLHQTILELPELDGRFVDSHELGRAYGTAMALISLGTLRDLESSKSP